MVILYELTKSHQFNIQLTNSHKIASRLKNAYKTTILLTRHVQVNYSTSTITIQLRMFLHVGKIIIQLKRLLQDTFWHKRCHPS